MHIMSAIRLERRERGLIIRHTGGCGLLLVGVVYDE